MRVGWATPRGGRGRAALSPAVAGSVLSPGVVVCFETVTSRYSVCSVPVIVEHTTKGSDLLLRVCGRSVIVSLIVRLRI